MAAKIKRAEYYYASIDDRPGAWARILEHLKKKKVNLLAVTAFPSGTGQTQIDFFAKDGEKLKNVARELNLMLTGPKSGFLVQGEDRAGALVEIHQKLADARINVTAANGSAAGSGRFSYVFWVNPSDFERAAQLLAAK